MRKSFKRSLPLRSESSPATLAQMTSVAPPILRRTPSNELSPPPAMPKGTSPRMPRRTPSSTVRHSFSTQHSAQLKSLQELQHQPRTTPQRRVSERQRDRHSLVRNSLTSSSATATSLALLSSSNSDHRSNNHGGACHRLLLVSHHGHIAQLICFFFVIFFFNVYYLHPLPSSTMVQVNKQSTLLQDFRQATLSSIGNGSSLYTLQEALSSASPLHNNPPEAKDHMDSSETPVVTATVPQLSCQAHGGPDSSEASDALTSMVYWKDIPADRQYVSAHATGRPNHDNNKPEQYLTFEPDEAGFNNQRMAFETTIALAWLTGRTVVLPPKVGIVNLRDKKKHQKVSFGFADFFDLPALQRAAGVKLMAFEDFLQTVALEGRLLDYHTGQPTFPPRNRTNWDSEKISRRVFKNAKERAVWDWLRGSTRVLDWDARVCVAAIPTQPGPDGVAQIQEAVRQVARDDAERFAVNAQTAKDEWHARWKSLRGHPTAVNGSTKDRLSEILADRKGVCVYDESHQQAQVLHITGEEKSGTRLLAHYYAFIFPQHWTDNIRMLRLIRDQLRYKDEIQCAAARIVAALRQEQPSSPDEGGSTGTGQDFYSMHVRRGDFQQAYPSVYLDVKDMYAKNLHLYFSEGRTVYIATDEKDKSYFDLLRKHYKIKFMSDYEHLLQHVDPAYYGMIDQLVAAAGSRFFGTYYSTFSGYIQRLIGFKSQRDRATGWQDGILDSYYLSKTNPCPFRKVMSKEYISVKPGYWEQEFPVAWRDLDHNVAVEEAGSEIQTANGVLR